MKATEAYELSFCKSIDKIKPELSNILSAIERASNDGYFSVTLLTPVIYTTTEVILLGLGYDICTTSIDTTISWFNAWKK